MDCPNLTRAFFILGAVLTFPSICAAANSPSHPDRGTPILGGKQSAQFFERLDKLEDEILIGLARLYKKSHWMASSELPVDRPHSITKALLHAELQNRVLYQIAYEKLSRACDESSLHKAPVAENITLQMSSHSSPQGAGPMWILGQEPVCLSPDAPAIQKRTCKTCQKMNSDPRYPFPKIGVEFLEHFGIYSLLKGCKEGSPLAIAKEVDGKTLKTFESLESLPLLNRTQDLVCAIAFDTQNSWDLSKPLDPVLKSKLLDPMTAGQIDVAPLKAPTEEERRTRIRDSVVQLEALIHQKKDVLGSRLLPLEKLLTLLKANPEKQWALDLEKCLRATLSLPTQVRIPAHKPNTSVLQSIQASVRSSSQNGFQQESPETKKEELELLETLSATLFQEVDASTQAPTKSVHIIFGQPGSQEMQRKRKLVAALLQSSQLPARLFAGAPRGKTEKQRLALFSEQLDEALKASSQLNLVLEHYLFNMKDQKENSEALIPQSVTQFLRSVSNPKRLTWESPSLSKHTAYTHLQLPIDHDLSHTHWIIFTNIEELKK